MTAEQQAQLAKAAAVSEPLASNRAWSKASLKSSAESALHMADSDTNPSLASLIDQRATALAAMAREAALPIHLYWSGGIDSSTALCAFLKLGPAAFRGTRLVVRYAPRAVAEWRSFFDAYLRPFIVGQRRPGQRDAYRSAASSAPAAVGGYAPGGSAAPPVIASDCS